MILVLKEKKNINSISIARKMGMLLDCPTEIYDNIDAKQTLLYDYCNKCRHTLSGNKISISCDKLAGDLKSKALWIKNHIRKTQWIESKEGYCWYNSYYDNHGRKVEGDFSNQVRMMLTGQVFMISSGISDDQQTKSIIKAVDKYLFDKNAGGYKLNTDFHEVKEDLGRMFGFAYGQKENGSVFSHMAIMYANSLYKKGFAKEGYKVIKSLYDHCIDFNKSKKYPGVPEYIDSKGRGVYNYLTGSASWLLLTVLTEIYGVKGDWGDLKIQPKLTLDQFDKSNQSSVEFSFLDHNFKAIFTNKLSKEFGNYKINKITIDDGAYVLAQG